VRKIRNVVEIVFSIVLWNAHVLFVIGMDEPKFVH